MRLLKTAQEIGTIIEEICQKAEKELVLVSPFIKFYSKYDGYWDKLERILSARVPHLDQFIVITKSTPRFHKRPTTIFLKKLGAKFLTLPTLHSKLVLNESSALFSSMNLYQYSAQNNYESGILIEKSDEGMLQDAKNYVNSLLEVAKIY
jgi:phosphatidylserine/phosphatidylglycerophosphate/cardiolipin synthase-like enzyme